MSAEVVVPVLFKGQVSLFGSRHLLSILEQLNGDFWWVEAAHMTDESVGFPELSRCTAVHLNLWWSYIETETSLTHVQKQFDEILVELKKLISDLKNIL